MPPYIIILNLRSAFPIKRQNSSCVFDYVSIYKIEADKMKKLVILILLIYSHSFAETSIPKEIRGHWYWYKYAPEGSSMIRRPDDRKVHELCYVEAGSLKYTDGLKYNIKRVHLREDTRFKRSYDLYFHGMEGYISVTLIKTAGTWSTIYRLGDREIIFYCLWIREKEFTEL
jgi:hypothetical protein